MTDLLGAASSPGLGGEAKERVDAMRSRAKMLRDSLIGAGWRHAQVGPIRDADHPDVLESEKQTRPVEC